MGIYDNTLILFCSDNGACPFERTRGRGLAPWDPESYWTYDASWAHAGNTPFRLYKQNQHEGGISSPLVVHWPAGLKTSPGSYTSQPGHLIDFMATFLDVGNATYPKQVGTRAIDPLQGLVAESNLSWRAEKASRHVVLSLWNRPCAQAG